MTTHRPRPGWGEALPLFRAAGDMGDVAGGRPALVLVAGVAGHPAVAEALSVAARHRALFDDVRSSFYAVTITPEDLATGRLADTLPGWRVIVDADRSLSEALGALEGEGGYRPYWLLADRTWRVVGHFELDQGEAAIAALRQLAAATWEPDWAPVVMVPHVLEPDFCRLLIAEHGRHAADPAGVMREVDGKTRLVRDAAVKVRRDYRVPPGEIAQQLLARFAMRLFPMVKRAFQYDATHIERWLVGCYDAAEGGHFRPHRDDVTRGTAHRRFAVTINLNEPDYEGGDLVFPEFGQRRYRAPTGTAIVFSCSLLHQVVPVTRGQRYAMLPFLLDATAAAEREANRAFVDYTPAAA